MNGYRNAEWYPDPTAGAALSNIARSGRKREQKPVIQPLKKAGIVKTRVWRDTDDGNGHGIEADSLAESGERDH